VAEEFTLEEVPRNRSAVYFYHWSITPTAGFVNFSSHKLFTSTGLAEDQYGGIRGRDDGDLLAHMSHRGTAADDLSKRSRFLLSKVGVLAFKFPPNVELLLELRLSLSYFLDRSAGCGEHEVHDHFQLLDSVVLPVDAYKVIEISTYSKAQLVCDLFDHSPEILVRSECVFGRCVIHTYRH
jgi:hypothetical protein